MTDPSTHRTITAALVIDTSKIERGMASLREALQPFAEAVATAVKSVARSMVKVGEHLRERANDPLVVAGLEARYAVRAGLDPAYRHPERRDALVRGLLAGKTGADDDGLLPFVTPENRRLLAVAAIRGWSASYETAGPYVAHRAWGSTHIEVSCA